ncbi:uncharacterized protein [Triticum aestivum]|uniref:uncharacterized protein isoform X1 n=1 Tax=Triticum aestivum TaxID=4565 RepID=UPI001D010755|nr:uncharacterized protein LOC123143969 isoform X1 [Triticum aestivum]
MRAGGLPYAYLLLPRDKTQNRSERRGSPARTPCSDGLGVSRASPWPSTTCSRVDGRRPPHLATSPMTGTVCSWVLVFSYSAGKQAWIHWMMYTHQVHLAFIIASNLILSLLAWWRGRQHGDGGSPRSHPLVSRGEQQAATAPRAHFHGPAEVKPTVAPETLAPSLASMGQRRRGKWRRRSVLASLGQ